LGWEKTATSGGYTYTFEVTVDVDEGTDAPVVHVPISVEDDVVVDPGTSTETITVPSAGIAASIEALKEAIAAGEVNASNSTVEILLPAPVDTSVAIEEVKVEIAVSNLRTLAASDAAQNVKIVSELGDVKLDTTALNDLVAQAQNAENVGVVIAH
jgi:hypothetical protein